MLGREVLHTYRVLNGLDVVVFSGLSRIVYAEDMRNMHINQLDKFVRLAIWL